MVSKSAECKCGNKLFIITDQFVMCNSCGTQYSFNFICEGICETKADDIVILINEGY